MEDTNQNEPELEADSVEETVEPEEAVEEAEAQPEPEAEPEAKADAKADATAAKKAKKAEKDERARRAAAEKAAKAREKEAAKAMKNVEKSNRSGIGIGAFVAGVAAALVVGVLVGFLVFNKGGVSLDGATTLSEGQLDSTIATYTYNGQTSNITARQVILESSSLDAAKDADGNYAVPSSDNVLGYARNQIVLAEASKQGFTVTDDEVAAYANDTLGTNDFATIASNYGLDEDTVKGLLSDAAVMKKLRDSVVTATVPSMPDAPTAPADGNSDTASADYAQYVTNLAGAEWDSANNTWASQDGPYYAALSGYAIANDSATYEAAVAAYQVAYSQYQTASTQVSTEWTSYVNSLLSNATIQMGSLQV